MTLPDNAASTPELPPHPSPVFRRWFPFSRLLVRLLARSFAPRLHISGRGNVPHGGAVILSPNHISDADPPFVASGVHRPLWFMGKRELFDIRFLGPMMRFYQTFPVDPGAPDREALRFSEALMQNEQALVIFPEGRCSIDGTLGEILPGAVLIALRSGAPVVPVGIWGTRGVVPYGSVVPRPTLQSVRVHYGKPLRFDDLKELKGRQARAEAAHRLDEAIKRCIKIARDT